jgi:hypothetical protein
MEALHLVWVLSSGVLLVEQTVTVMKDALKRL